MSATSAAQKEPAAGLSRLYHDQDRKTGWPPGMVRRGRDVLIPFTWVYATNGRIRGTLVGCDVLMQDRPRAVIGWIIEPPTAANPVVLVSQHPWGFVRGWLSYFRRRLLAHRR